MSHEIVGFFCFINGNLHVSLSLSLALHHCSTELRNAVKLVTNVEPPIRTEADIKEAFDKADADQSGGLSRTEFLALYLSLVTKRLQANPAVSD